MLTGENRRTFLSALLLAGGSAAAFAESYRQGDAVGQPAGDALFIHIQLQLAATLRAVNARGGLVADDAAAGARYMRICAAHARGLNLDMVAREAMSRRLARTSRDALFAASPTLSTVASRLARKGIIVSDRIRRDLASAEPDARAAAIAVIQDGRSSVACDRIAEALEVATPRLAERLGPVRRVAMADEWWCNFYVAQWSMHLALAWSLASLEDQSLQDFIDAMWAGFVFYEQIYSSQC